MHAHSRGARPRKRGSSWIIGGGLVVLIVVGCSVILLERRHGPPPASPSPPEVTEINSLRHALEEQNQAIADLTDRIRIEQKKHEGKQQEAEEELARLRKDIKSLEEERSKGRHPYPIALTWAL